MNKKNDKKIIEEYFSNDLLKKLPLNYRYAEVFHVEYEISDEEKEGMDRFFKNEKYKTDSAGLKHFYKSL